jgi:hypothetical protein
LQDLRATRFEDARGRRAYLADGPGLRDRLRESGIDENSASEVPIVFFLLENASRVPNLELVSKNSYEGARFCRDIGIAAIKRK